ncbi:MAG: serine/threonine-protein kinase [Candidatus Eremiobacterota bacterium]
MILETGTVLNDIYRVVKLLGKGSMGNVYLVDRIKYDKKFVLKELNFSQEACLDISTAKEIFHREAEFMVKINHPGVPKMYGVFSQDGRDYLAMDYIEGKTLEEIINSSRKPVEENKAITWTIQIAEIIDYLHNSFQKPLVYRDLKPSNIIIKPDGKPVLVDFGIARYYNPDKDSDTFNYGTPGYAAPEQYKGKEQSTPQSDIFGLGVILFQLVTKYDPSLKPLQFPSIKGLNPLISEKLEGIIFRSIQLDPLKRYISVMEFKETLEKYKGTHIYPAIREEHEYVPGWYKKAKRLAILSLLSPFIIFFIRGVLQGTHILYLEDSYLVGLILLLICPVSGIAVSISGIRKTMERKMDFSEYFSKSIGYNIIAFIIGISFYSCMSHNLHLSAIDGMFLSCDSNLIKIATAQEAYATDNMGLYPSTLSRLLEKNKDKGPYINKIPICAKNMPHYLINFRNKNYSQPYQYKVSEDFRNFTIWCTCNHIDCGIEQGYPQYTPGKGLIPY